MRGLHDESIDLIYLDPPFNSKHNYAAPIGSKAAGAAFKDTWTLSDIDMAWWGEIAKTNQALYWALKSAGHISGNSVKAYLIYMAIRLIEMHRILKPSGSIYLHCDPTMSHYLKMVLDSVFGHENFKNELVWKRSTAHNDASRFGAIHDIILFYVKSNKYLWNKIYTPYSEEYIKRYYKFTDKRGRFWTDNISAKGLQGGGYDFEYRGIRMKWRFPEHRIKELDADDRIYWPTRKGSLPKIKRYLDDAKGIPLQDLIIDIKPLAGLGANQKERLGYPTQKPLGLLERLIESSSTKDCVILDPFCGCATACHAAERLGRQWLGIDISEIAAELIRIRLNQDITISMAGGIIHRTDIPKREGTRTREIKCTLYGKQEGRCNGCKQWFQYQNLEEDHIMPISKGGLDDDSNIQLLCGFCNRTKGDRDMPYLISRLKELGII